MKDKNKADNNKKDVEPKLEAEKATANTCAADLPAGQAGETASKGTPQQDTRPTDDPRSFGQAAAELSKLQEEIESLRKAASERNEFLNLLQRVQADFANYQKRIRKEKECWDKYQDEGLIKELLPALDNFGRTLKTQCSTEEAKCIMSGIELIQREIFRVLEKRGIKPIKTVGEKFDANYHEAVGICETDKCKEDEIVEEITPGYTLYDRLLRAAKVKVAKPKPGEKKN